MDRGKSGKGQDSALFLKYKHFEFMQHPILPPICISVAAFSRMVRSPTPSGKFGDSVIERSSISNMITLFSGIETPITVATSETISEDDGNNDNSEGYALDRFLGEIDEYFKCPFCRKIVRKPQECIYCQNLMCKSCVSNVFRCPYGCESLQINQPSKYAMLSYLKLQIKCCFAAAGCEHVGSIKDINDHEKECDYSEIKCMNPVCDAVFIKKNMPSDGPVICSEICNMALNFKGVLDTGNSEEFLKEFVKVIEEAKSNMQNELTHDLEELMTEARRKKEEVEEYLKAKNDLYLEIEDWRNYYHSGKWNQVVKWWNCCEVREKYSQGCTLIG